MTIAAAQGRQDGGDPVRLAPIEVRARDAGADGFMAAASISSIEGSQLEDAGVSSVLQLPSLAPGMSAMAANPRLTSVSIRGLGSNPFNDGIESSVGIFIDDVYVARQSYAIFDFVDIDRVEVLRGPQGVVFGKNTTAGAVHILTRAPSFSPDGGIEASYGRFGDRQLRGHAGGALVEDRLAGRIAGYVSRREGLVDNLHDGRKLNDRHRQGARAQLLWTPDPDWSGRLIAETAEVDEVCCYFAFAAPIRPAVTARDEYMEYRRASSNPSDYVADIDADIYTRLGQNALTARLDRRWSPEVTISSISAWRDWHFAPMNDDATSLRLVTGGLRNEHDQLSQEVRIQRRGVRSGATAGLLLLRQHLAGREDALLGEDLAAWVFGGLLREQLPFATRSNSGLLLDALIPPQTLAGMTVRTPYRQRADSASAYGSIAWKWTDRIETQAGLRYTHERKTASVSRSRQGGNPQASPLSALDALTPLGELLGVDFRGLTFEGLLDQVAGGEFQRSDRYEEGDISGGLSASYRLAEGWMAYVSAQRGVKGGGINLGVTGETVKPTFRPERATSFEAGVRGRLPHRGLSLAAAVYDTRVRDYQALTFDEDTTFIPNPRMNNLLNIGRVRLQGVEAEAGMDLSASWFLRLAAAYNRAITEDFTNAPDEDTRSNTRDLSGRQLYNAPRWTLAANLMYRRPLSGSLEFRGGIDHYLRSATFGTVEHGRASYIDGYGITGARAAIGEGAQGWELALWIRNLLDVEYVTATQPIYGVGDYGAVAGDPRVWGVTAQWQF